MPKWTPRSGASVCPARRRRTWLLAALVVVPAVALASCERSREGDPFGPAGAPLLSLHASIEGGPAEAFQRTDRLSVRVRTEGAVVHEETVAFSPRDGARVPVRLSPTLVGSPIEVEVTLRAGSAPIFRGSGSAVVAEGGPTSIELSLVPVVAAIHLDDPIAVLTAIGETHLLTAVAVFATGEAIADPGLSWISLDPNVLQVQSDGTAQSLAEGEARVEVHSGDVSATGRVLVQAEVASVQVEPSTPSLGVGQSLPLQFQARDRNGNLLGGRSAEWTSLDERVATVSPDGVVQGVGQGETEIRAAVEGVFGAAVVTVLGTPQPPSALQGEILDDVLREYRLTWADNSTNETRFAVERRVDGGLWVEVASRPANSTVHTGVGEVGANDFRVRACSDSGCSAPSNEVRLTFVGQPPRVETLPAVVDSELWQAWLRGHVSSADPYVVRFQFGTDPELDRCSESQNCEETPSRQGSTTATWMEAIPSDVDWWLYLGVYFRIVAENDYGESVGSTEYVQDSSFGAPPQSASPEPESDPAPQDGDLP